jgi:GPH family glycoside/pentoside/hexuronide:cation symporter
MAAVMAALILLSAAVCYRSTRSAPFHVRTPRLRVPLREELRRIMSNRPLSLLLIQKGFWYFGFAANQAALAYFIKYMARLSDFWLGAYYIVLPVGMIAAQPLWLAVSRRLDKKYASMLSMGLFGVLELTWLLTGPEEPKWIIVVRLLGLGASAGGAILLIQSMFNDTIEFNYRRTQSRREGAFTGLFSLVEKGFTAFGVAALGGFLGVMGYVSSKGQGLIHQPHSAVVAIGIGFCVVPFVTACCAIGAIAFYSLNRAALAGAAEH